MSAIPAHLTLALRRELIGQYGDAAESAHSAAEACLRTYDDAYDPAERTSELSRHRARIADLELLFDLLADDLAHGDDIEVPADRRTRRLLGELVEDTIRVSRDVMATGDEPEEIIANGKVMEALLALRAELEPEAVTA